MISILTHGDASDGGGVAADSLETTGGTTTTTATASPGSTEGAGGATTHSSAAAGGRGAGLASMVELQEKEIAGLREELSEALSRVPRGGGEGGGVSALEGALRNQVSRNADLLLCKGTDSLGLLGPTPCGVVVGLFVTPTTMAVA